jgi:TPR repeat protein
VEPRPPPAAPTAKVETSAPDVPDVTNDRTLAEGAPPVPRWMRRVALGLVACAPLGGALSLWRHSTTPSVTTPECEAACKARVRGACEALAMALVHGKGAPRDPSRAADLYTSACDAGSMSACSALGALYGLGDGVPQNDGKAVELYTQACDGGFARGCLNEGGMYFDGTGVQKNERRGADLFRQACDGGEPLGCKNLSIAYRTGRGRAKSEERAREYEAKSVEAKTIGSTSGHR